jgi:hypothetical protein
MLELWVSMRLLNKALTIWKYALGSFSDDRTKEYDNYVVVVRSVIFFSYLITNCFIISGVIRHWNNVPTERLPIQHQSIQEKYIG